MLGVVDEEEERPVEHDRDGDPRRREERDPGSGEQRLDAGETASSGSTTVLARVPPMFRRSRSRFGYVVRSAYSDAAAWTEAT